MPPKNVSPLLAPTVFDQRQFIFQLLAFSKRDPRVGRGQPRTQDQPASTDPKAGHADTESTTFRPTKALRHAESGESNVHSSKGGGSFGLGHSSAIVAEERSTPFAAPPRLPQQSQTADSFMRYVRMEKNHAVARSLCIFHLHVANVGLNQIDAYLISGIRQHIGSQRQRPTLFGTPPNSIGEGTPFHFCNLSYPSSLRYRSQNF